MAMRQIKIEKTLYLLMHLLNINKTIWEIIQSTNLFDLLIAQQRIL